MAHKSVSQRDTAPLF